MAVDLSLAMLRVAPRGVGALLAADAAALLIRDGGADVVVCVDVLVFSSEIARVTASNGAIVWVSRLGSDAPLYLPAEQVAALLPGTWSATTSDAGWGSWAVLRRE